MHCFASENQTYTGLWLLALSLVFKGQENLLLKNLQVKTRVENVRFLSWRIFFVGKYGIQSTNEMAFKRTVTLRASFRFPATRFDAPTLLSFSGFTHAHPKCSPVGRNMVHPGPIDPYFLAIILIPGPHFPPNFDPWALIRKIHPIHVLHKILT